MNYKHRIAERFAASREGYDCNASVQKDVAKNLALSLPDLKEPRILELGCGTGFLTQYLFDKYPDGIFDITDLSDQMVSYCENKLPHDSAKYFVLDAEETDKIAVSYDLIVSSMSVQWFEDPLKTLNSLRKIAPVYYTTLGQENFKEWQICLNSLNLQNGMHKLIEWPGIFSEEKILDSYNIGINFLKRLKNTGVSMPHENYKPLSISEMRRALQKLEIEFNSQITWHIVYASLYSS